MIGLDHLGEVSRLEEKKKWLMFCVFESNSETSINFHSCYRLLLQKGKCVWYVWSTLWDKQNNLEQLKVTALLRAHDFIFITLQCRWNANYTSGQLPLSSSYFLPCAIRENFSPNTTIPSCLVSFWLSQWICFFTYFLTHYKKLKSVSFQNNCFAVTLTRWHEHKKRCVFCFENSHFSRISCIP